MRRQYKKEELLLNEKSCNTILDTAKLVYNEEIDRYKISETKAQILLAFTGVVLSFFINTLVKSEIDIRNIKFLIVTIFNLMILGLLGYAIKSLIYSITMGDFAQVDVEDLTTKKFASTDECIVMMQIATTYKNVIKENRILLEKKMNHLKDALWYLKNALFVIVILVIIKEVLKIV